MFCNCLVRCIFFLEDGEYIKILSEFRAIIGSDICLLVNDMRDFYWGFWWERGISYLVRLWSSV